MAVLALSGIACGIRAPKQSPNVFLATIDQLQTQGKAAQSRQKAEEALALFGSQDPYWRWRFSLYLDPGPDRAHQALLTYSLPSYVKGSRAEVIVLWDRAAENANERESLWNEAHRLAESLRDDWALARVDYRIAEYWLQVQHEPAKAGEVLESVVARARLLKEPVLLPRALVNLSVTRTRLDRHDEAIALCLEAAKLLESTPNDETLANLENNLGWSWLQLGDGDEALRHLDRSASLFRKIGSQREVFVLRNQAAYYSRRLDFAHAREKLDQAAEAASKLPADEQAGVWADHAEVDFASGQPDAAIASLGKARRFSNFNGPIRSQEDAHIRFVESMAAELRHDSKAAEAGYREVINSETAWSFLRLEAALRRAQSLVAANRNAAAERQYNEAEDLLETMRNHLKEDESKLSFFEDSATFYDRYVDFLVSRGADLEALQVADRSRARLLSDYQSDQRRKIEPLSLERLQSQLRDSVALFYWVGDGHAYVWIIGQNLFKRVDLLSPGEIHPLAQKYLKATSTGGRDLTPDDIETGRRLRDILLAKASPYLPPGRRVFLMLDDKLGQINPESLPGFHSDYWIEEAIVSVVPSLAMLQSAPPLSTATQSMLAIGDADGTKDFPKLANAAAELSRITGLFPKDRYNVISGARARPSAYRNSDPVQYEMIHFTAHGQAAAINPLDSAVILSEDPDNKAFKLYARDIVKIPIQARLVTISACKSAAGRTYRGEGVVGLAWAFLRAGAGQVVAGLWNIDDEASQQLMVMFYQGMRLQHKSPAIALRDAKLQLMKGYRNPYYWAPFEIFAGYIEP